MFTRVTFGRYFSQIVFCVYFLLKCFSAHKLETLFSYCKKTKKVFTIMLHSLVRDLEGLLPLKQRAIFCFYLLLQSSALEFFKENKRTRNSSVFFCIDIKLSLWSVANIFNLIFKRPLYSFCLHSFFLISLLFTLTCCDSCFQWFHLVFT